MTFAPTHLPRFLTRWLLTLGFALFSHSALTQAPTSAISAALPAVISAALTQAQLPPEAVSLVLVDADGLSAPRLSHRAEVLAHPASVMKLLTTTAALDLLGPTFSWHTPVWVDGPVRNGVLQGNLVIAGQGDPALTQEKLWLLLRRVQGLGIRRIDGDIVLDRSGFALPASQPGDFDGEPLRPYNASPEALLVNFKSLLISFVPDPTNRVARVLVEPPLWGLQAPDSVPLRNSPGDGCGDYRASLQADFSDPARIRFAGSYPQSCGEKVWPVAYVDPASYSARAIEGLWRGLGGQLRGRVREGQAPATPATLEAISPTLAEVIRDINKYSNNVMAQQLFLTLGRDPGTSLAQPPATLISARERLQQWWQQRVGSLPAPILDNGSGLSRQERISAGGLARLLQLAYASPFMPELMSSLPVVGLDGTLKRSRATLAGAHLKTGSLRDVLALAGYVHGPNGRQLCLVVLINHPNAGNARPAMESIVDWAVAEAARPGAVGH